MPLTQTQRGTLATTTNATSYALSPSATPAAGSLALLWVHSTVTTGSANTVTVTGGGVTWTQVDTLQFNGTLSRLSLFRASGTFTAGNLTIAPSPTQTAQSCVAVLVEVAGADTTTDEGVRQAATVADSGSARTVTTATLSALGAAGNRPLVGVGYTANTATGGSQETDATLLGTGNVNTPPTGLGVVGYAAGDTTPEVTHPSARSAGLAVEVVELAVAATDVSFAGTAPLQGLSAVVDAAPPEFAVSFAGTAPLPTLAVVVDAAPPGVYTVPLGPLVDEYHDTSAAAGTTYEYRIVSEGDHGETATAWLPVTVPASDGRAVSFAGTAPLQTLAAGLTHTPPVFAVSFAGVGPLQVLSASLSVAAPGSAVQFAGTGPLQAFAASVGHTAPVFAVSFAGVGPLQSFTATVGVVAPGQNISFAGTAPLQSFTASITRTIPVRTVAFAGTAPLPVLSVSVAHVAPGFPVSFAGTGPLQTLSATVSYALPGYGVAFGGVGPLQTFTASLTRTVPVFAVSFAGVGPLQVLRVQVYPGEIPELPPLETLDLDLLLTRRAAHDLLLTRRLEREALLVRTPTEELVI
jgi:hypothetical protein